MSQVIKVELIKLAAYYEKILTDEQLSIYSEQLNQALSEVECAQACRLYINDPKNEFFPRPVSKLIALIQAPLSNEDVAQNVSSLLMQAERKFGVHWTEGHLQAGETIFAGKDISYRSWRDAAKSMFGETGLQIVDRYGGWKEFCVNVYDSPDGVVRAQIKNLAASLQNTKQRTGSFDALPASGSGAQVHQLFQNIKTIEGVK